jgi:GTPase SAR1 family protein/MFS family permease
VSNVFNNRNFRILDIISLVLAIAVWQFKLNSSMATIMIGLVLPAVVLVWGRWSENEGRAASLSFFAILFAIFNWPFGFELILERVLIIFIAVVVVLLLKPTIEFISGVLFSFWIHFLSVFLFTYLASWTELFSSNILNEIIIFTYSAGGMANLVVNNWWVYLLVGFVLSLLNVITYEPQVNNRFFIIGGIVAFPVLAVGFVFSGIVYAVFTSVRIYINQLEKHVTKESNLEEEELQPAKKIYLFEKAFLDWKAILQRSLIENIDTSKLFAKKVKNHKKYYGWVTFLYSSLFWLCASAIVYTLGSLWIAVASFVHIAAVVITGLPFYILSGVIWSLDKGYRKRNKVQMLCPSCHHASEMPIYVCHNCSSEHTRLIPGAYGTLKRKCTCGEKLPTTFFNGRANLEARCPNCKSNQESRESTPIAIPIIGGPSVGKTCFMISATRGILEEVAPKQQWDVKFMNDNERQNFESVSNSLVSGSLPSKTVNGEIMAFNFFISNKKWSTDKMVYFYDPAGESFSEMNNLKGHTYYENNHGNVFMIDPFSIAEISKKYELEQDYYSTVNPSGSSLEEIFDRLMIYFQEQYGLKPHQKITKPIAFVINKVDAYNLDQRIGEKAAQELMAQNPSVKTIEDAIHQLCYKMLAEVGMNNFLRKIDDKFLNYRFFASSAIKGSEFTSVEKPILWVLSEADKDLKVS